MTIQLNCFQFLSLIWPLFIFFVTAHIFSNYKAVKAVCMNTFNRNRFHIFAQNYLKSTILEPSSVNKQEPVLHTCSRFFTTIKLGCSIKQFKNVELDVLLKDFEAENFSVNFNIKGNIIQLGPFTPIANLTGYYQ